MVPPMPPHTTSHVRPTITPLWCLLRYEVVLHHKRTAVPKAPVREGALEKVHRVIGKKNKKVVVGIAPRRRCSPLRRVGSGSKKKRVHTRLARRPPPARRTHVEREVPHDMPTPTPYLLLPLPLPSSLPPPPPLQRRCVCRRPPRMCPLTSVALLGARRAPHEYSTTPNDDHCRTEKRCAPPLPIPRRPKHEVIAVDIPPPLARHRHQRRFRRTCPLALVVVHIRRILLFPTEGHPHTLCSPCGVPHVVPSHSLPCGLVLRKSLLIFLIAAESFENSCVSGCWRIMPHRLPFFIRATSEAVGVNLLQRNYPCGATLGILFIESPLTCRCMRNTRKEDGHAYPICTGGYRSDKTPKKSTTPPNERVIPGFPHRYKRKR